MFLCKYLRILVCTFEYLGTEVYTPSLVPCCCCCLAISASPFLPRPFPISCGFLSIMTRCELCKSLTAEILDNDDVPFHDSLSSLKRSAQSGCDFCNLCWGRIKSDWHPDRVDVCLQGLPLSQHPEDQHWVQQMWLRGYFYLNAPDSVRGSDLWLSCGQLGVENVNKGLATHLSLFATPGRLNIDY